MRTRMSGGVTGKAGDSLPMFITSRVGLEPLAGLLMANDGPPARAARVRFVASLKRARPLRGEGPAKEAVQRGTG